MRCRRPQRVFLIKQLVDLTCRVKRPKLKLRQRVNKSGLNPN